VNQQDSLAIVKARAGEALSALPPHVREWIQEVSVVGSSVVEGSAPNDLDILVLLKAPLRNRADWPGEDCLKLEEIVDDPETGREVRTHVQKEYFDGKYQTVTREGDVNWLVTANSTFYRQFIAAARICRATGVRTKEARVEVHRICFEYEDDSMDPEELLVYAQPYPWLELIKGPRPCSSSSDGETS